MIIEAFDIKYEVDGEAINPPSKLDIEFDDNASDSEIEEELADKISDATGWLVISASWKKK